MTNINVPGNVDHWLGVPGKTAWIGVDDDLVLNVYVGESAEPAWQSSTVTKPTAQVLASGASEPSTVGFAQAAQRQVAVDQDITGV